MNDDDMMNELFSFKVQLLAYALVRTLLPVCGMYMLYYKSTDTLKHTD